ncbi:MAG: hypothetical protein HYX60_06485, partial [Legionella longbeachae]|nr:hypothetical protein [Legionella longbeachae]
ALIKNELQPPPSEESLQDYNQRFTEYFQTNIEQHLSTKDEEIIEKTGQTPEKAIHEAISTGEGAFSRVLDMLQVPVPKYEDLLRYINEKGSLSTYIQSLIEPLLPIVLNEEKTALSDKLIQAINKNNSENYQEMLKKIGGSEKIAVAFIKAMVSGYGQQLSDMVLKTPGIVANAWYENESKEIGFLALKHITLDGIKKSAQGALPDKKTLETNIDELRKIFSSLFKESGNNNNLVRRKIDNCIDGLKEQVSITLPLASYLNAIEEVLKGDDFTKLTIEEKSKFVNLVDKCPFFEKYGYASSEDFNKIKVSYLEAIKGELQEENFNKRSIEEKIKFVNLLNDCSVF